MQTLSPEAKALRDRADDLASAGDLKGSLTLFLEAVALCPAHALLHEAIAQIQDELDDHETAFRSAERAVELAPEVKNLT